MCVVTYFIGRLIHHGRDCPCVFLWMCLYPLPPQYHLKGKKVYNLSLNLVSERFHLFLGNINSFMSMFRESLWFGKGRDFQGWPVLTPLAQPSCSLHDPRSPRQHDCEPPNHSGSHTPGVSHFLWQPWLPLPVHQLGGRSQVLLRLAGCPGIHHTSQLPRPVLRSLERSLPLLYLSRCLRPSQHLWSPT